MASTRRMILLGGLGAAGALVVGAVAYVGWPRNNIVEADALAAGPNERFINNWIKIAQDDTVTVVIPHCDMGTGIYTALPQMAAEELDADWSKVKVEAAPADAIFANGPLGEGFILSTQGMTDKDIPAFARGLVSNTFRTIASFMDLQVTGGSSAVRATGVYGMRIAGAAAREMLVKAAAARWNVDPSACVTRANRVIHTASNRSFGYGQLVADAATYSPSSTPQLKPRSQYTLVGKPIARVDIPKKVNGTTNYGLDVKQPDMLYAAIRISPVFGGKLKSVDSSAIDHKRGIVKTVRLDDAVVVIADRFWRARDAVAALDPQWDTNGNGAVTSAQIDARHNAALKSDDLKKDISKGDGPDALNRGRLIEATYNVPYLSHAPMEPMNATALWRSDGTLEVWSGTQDGLGSRAFCAKVANLPMDKVTFHLLPMGGGFGRRLPGYFNFLEHAVRTAQALPGKPIKLIWTRDQDMQHDYYRPNVTSHFRAALRPNGMPVAWLNDYTTDSGANSEAHIVYDIDNQALRTAKVETHIPTGPWRSVEASWHGFFIETFVDELAHAANIDPVAYRRRLLQHEPRHLAVLNTVAEKAEWGTPLGPNRARGVAIFECFQTIVAHVAEITLSGGTLKVDRVVTAVDAGMAVNPDGMKAQIEGGIIYGLSAALNGEITIDKGAVVQANFPDYEVVRLADCPQIEVHLLTSDAPLGGAGEPGVPPLAPAVANAVFAATGQRIRSLPLKNHNLTVAQR
ncbi:MAG: xanthine dehydrogenase family protein molybdopterin-binding subunit [Alphaproteobacteria bacterium]|nr:xanthine dehydrogenase family protein molybdopterin-binding subunit [Alphaproteobacteria bacterium]MBL7098470.1 xanthine dehydrogenase family protein molybdopterin-binding subunit [Alphaproteobacteria bacterium]